MKANLLILTILIVACLKSNGQSTSWDLTGNAGTTPGTNFVGTTGTEDLSFRTNGTTDNFPKMQLEVGGQLGIGTTTPNSWLHVISTGTKETFRTDVPDTYDNYWRMYRNGVEYGRFYHLYGSAGGGTGLYIAAPRGNMRFMSGSGGTVTPALEIYGTNTNASGNVLIGDYSTFGNASARLHVKGNGYTTLFKVENSTQSTPALSILETEQQLFKSRSFTGSTTEGAFDFRYEPGSSVSDAYGFYGKTNANASNSLTGFNFETINTNTSGNPTIYGVKLNSSTSSTNGLVHYGLYSSNGGGNNSVNFGAYITTPFYSQLENCAILAYSGDAPFTYGLKVESKISHTSITNGTECIGVRSEAGGALTTIGVYGIGSEITDGEIFGLKGLAEDNANLSNVNAFYGVWGKAPIQNCTTVGGVSTCSGAAGYFDGDVFAMGGVYSNSDLNFKNQITPVQNASSILSQIQTKQYSYNQQAYPSINLPKDMHYGFIAQEVEPILPNIVKDFHNPMVTDSNGAVIHPGFDFKSVNYIEFVPLLVGAFNEQRLIIDSLITALNNAPRNAPPINEQNRGQKIELSDITSIILNQNDPNPFSESTRITYVIPETVSSAKIVFTNNSGSVINTVVISERGSSELQVFSSELSSGIYTYTLVCDGKIIDSKKMIKH